MKKTVISVFCIAGAMFAGMNAGAQTKDGGISADLLTEISKGYEGTAADKAIRNALNTTPINTLALNAENEAMIDTHFSDMVTTKGRTNQKSSGRCWLFTGLNVLRSEMIQKYNLGEFTFSQNYLFFYDQLEKANLFLQGIIDTRDLPIDDRKVDWLFSHPIDDGGQFTGVANLVTKYGVVPSEVMPETYVSNSTSQMAVQLKTKLREDGLRLREAKAKDVKAMKVEMLKEIYHILGICLGVPPTEFEYTLRDASDKVISTETYTPQSFYKKYLDKDLEHNYVMVMNDPVREYWQVYEIDYDRHVYDGQNWLYVNLPIEEIKEMAIKSIKDNTAMYFSCDVGKFAIRDKGVLDINNYDYESLMGVKFGMDKRERVLTHASGSSHAMTLIAVDLKDGKPTKWMVENSWGSTGYKGSYIMTDEWFNEYMFRLVLDRKYVSDKVLKVLEKKPVMLPAWDPMFMAEE